MSLMQDITNFDLFVSYKSHNVNLVRCVVDRLIASGLTIWFAEYQIRLVDRDSFQTDIDHGTSKSRNGLLFTNDRFSESEYCEREVRQLLSSPICGPTNIIEIQIPEEPATHQKYPELGLSNSLCFDPQGQGVDEIVEFVTKKLGISCGSNKRGAFRNTAHEKYEDPVLGYRITAAGWNLYEKGSLEIAPNGNINGPAFKMDVNGSALAANLIIGPADTPIKKAVPFADHYDYYQAIRRSIGTITDQYKKGLIPSDDAYDRMLFDEAVEFALNFKKITGIEPLGVHLFQLGNSSHFAMTYRSENLWMRRYAIVLNDPITQKGIEFAFVFSCLGTPKVFFSHTDVFENILFSFEAIPQPKARYSQSAEPIYGRANQAIMAGDYDAAVRLYVQGVELDDANGPEYFNKLGDNIRRMGYPEAAEKCFAKARRVAGKD